MRQDPLPLGKPQFKRLALEAYDTLDAPMAVRALADVIELGTNVLEPAAGMGHLVLELRKLGCIVTASDLKARRKVLVDGIEGDRNIFDITALPFDSLVTNLPYESQDQLLKHLLPIAARDGCLVAVLTRAAWHLGKHRRELVHRNPWFQGIVHLPRRPWWSEERTNSPRHDFVWCVWGAQQRTSSNPLIYYPGD